MRYLRRSFILSLSLLILMGLSATAAFAQDPERGQTIYAESNCKWCHGENGEGVWGRTLAGSEADAADWVNQVRNPRNNMPSYSEAQIPDQDIIDMHAHFSSQPAPDEPGYNTQEPVPEDAHPGQVAMFENRCVACHGPNGPGGFARRNEVPQVEDIRTQVRTPRRNMPSFSEEQVTEEEIVAITEFLASQVSPPELPQSGAAQASSGLNLSWTLVMLGLAALSGGWLLKRRLLNHS